MIYMYYLIIVAVVIASVLLPICIIVTYNCYWKKRQKTNHSTHETSSLAPPAIKDTIKKQQGTYKRIAIDVYDTASELEESSEESEIRCWSEAEAVTVAAKSTCNLLRTNMGKIYTSKPDDVHVEILFIRDNQSLSQVTALWLKNLPCQHCSERLITHFKYNRKPDIFIGSIPSNTQLLSALKEAGFKICNWKSLDKMLVNGNNSSLAERILENNN